LGNFPEEILDNRERGIPWDSLKKSKELIWHVARRAKSQEIIWYEL